MQGQIGRSQSYTIEKLLPNVDDNDEIVERKTFRNRKLQKHWSAIARSLFWSRIQVLNPAVQTPQYYGQFAFLNLSLGIELKALNFLWIEPASTDTFYGPGVPWAVVQASRNCIFCYPFLARED